MLKAKSTDEFRKIQHKQKQKEFVREHFEQYFNGVKIEGAGYNFHYKNGKMFFAHGHYVSVNNVDAKPSITQLEAMGNFARYKNIPIKDVSNYIVELIIKEIPEKIDTLPVLVYKVYLYADYPQNTEIGFIDAHTGNLRMTEPAFIDISSTGTFATRYSGVQQGATEYYQGGYHLADFSRNAVIHTWNLEGRTSIPSRIELADNDNSWTQTEHRSNNNDMALDVQWALQSIYDRLYNTHNINSMDDDGFTIDAHIRYGTNYNNAFWDPNDRTLSFGEGGSIFRSVASLDVVAHEFGHGISYFQIGWGNTIDERAFNEGMSDIWGVIMEQRIRPNSVWQIGEQITLNYACLRNIQNTNASDARDKIANTFSSAQYNSGNNYVRGGVFSHWFYLLVNGGTGTNDSGRSYSVQGVGMDMAENLIVKAVYDGYLRFTTSYAQIRTSMINAAREIAGTNSYLEHQIENAWYAVGVGNLQYQYLISGPSFVCPSSAATFTINNAPSNYTWGHSTNLTPINGSPASFTTSFAGGNAWVSVNVNGKEISRKNFIIGSQITGVDQIAYVQTNRYYADPVCSNQNNIWVLSWQGMNILTEKPDTVYGKNYVDVVSTTSPNYMTTYNLSLIQDNGYRPIKYISVNGVKLRLVGIKKPNPFPPIELLLYPNPVADILTVEIKTDDTDSNNATLARNTNTNIESYTIQLWNERQGLMRTIEITASIQQISLQELPVGMYFVHIVKDGKMLQRKIVWKN